MQHGRIASGQIGIVFQTGVGRVVITDIFVPEIGEAEIQHGLRIRVMGRMAVQNYGNQPEPVPLRAGDEGVACQRGIAGLSADDSGIILVGIFLQHLMAAVDGKTACVRRVRRELVISRGIELHKSRIAEGRLGDQCVIIRRGIVIRIVQARGIRKMGVLAAEIRGFLVHEICEGFDAAGAVFGKRVRDLVCRFQEHGIQRFPDSDLVPGVIACTGGSALHVVDGIVGEGERIVQTAAFNDDQRSQDLCDACGKETFMQVFSVDHTAGIRIHQDSAFRFDGDLIRPRNSGSDGPGDRQGKNQNNTEEEVQLSRGSSVKYKFQIRKTSV